MTQKMQPNPRLKLCRIGEVDAGEVDVFQLENTVEIDVHALVALKKIPHRGFFERFERVVREVDGIFRARAKCVEDESVRLAMSTRPHLPVERRAGNFAENCLHD